MTGAGLTQMLTTQAAKVRAEAVEDFKERLLSRDAVEAAAFVQESSRPDQDRAIIEAAIEAAEKGGS